MSGFNNSKIPEEYSAPIKIVSMLFQSFFPPVNLGEVQIKKFKRVVLINLKLDSDNDKPEIEFRHYDIELQKYSMKKTISNLINNLGKTKDLSNFNNISDYILKHSGYSSCSDNEEEAKCEIIDEKSNKNEKTTIKLREIGPRMNLRIFKIQEGFFKGNVVYHSLIKKTRKEIYEILTEKKMKEKEKKERQKTQEENIIKKQEQKGIDRWEVLIKPAKRLKIGNEVIFNDGELVCILEDVLDNGNRVVKFKYDGNFYDIIDKIGQMPLPHYITKKLENKDRYQTVYSKELGSIAAPTAGLHFTKELLSKIEKKGVKIKKVTLHVGIGTFRPVTVSDIKDHKMHSESYFIDQDTAAAIVETKKNNGRVISVGTTACRVLETVAKKYGEIKEDFGETDIFIYPPYNFKVIDGLITNFHLPESTLIMLVSALAGREVILKAYEHAKKNNYRFYSFGDAMLII